MRRKGARGTNHCLAGGRQSAYPLKHSSPITARILLTHLEAYSDPCWFIFGNQMHQMPGFSPIISIDRETAEERFASEPMDRFRPDMQFDRHWALALLTQTVETTLGSGWLFL